MTYCEEFKDLVINKSEIYDKDGYIGHGNPNASILFIGQEPALQYKSDEYIIEIENNSQDWKRLILTGFSFEEVERYVKNEQFSEDSGYLCPLHPWPKQRYIVRSEIKGKDGDVKKVRGALGTSKTWCQYQKLINYIMENLDDTDLVARRGDLLNFHKFSFHTDMNAVSSRTHNVKGIASHKSAIERMTMLKHPFFQKFSIVIAAVGHFPRQVKGDDYFKNIFDVEYLGNYAQEGMTWINVSERKVEKPMLLIHCPQLTYRKINDAWLKRIAEIVSDFTKKKDIYLI